jgi:multiple sugar transport system ATP-binding protein
VQQVGSPGEIYNTPANLFVADFMGSPSMNLLKGQVAKNGGAAAITFSAEGGSPVKLAAPTGADISHLQDGAAVILGIRPEAVSDLQGVDRSAKNVASIDAPVEIVEPAGSDTFVVTRIAGQEITARMRADTDLRPGQVAAFAFNLDKAVLFDPQTGNRLGGNRIG